MTTTNADLLNVTTSDGKYTLIQTAEGAMKALRYGEVWDVGTREAIGDNRLLTFAQDLAAARELLQACHDAMWELHCASAGLAADERAADRIHDLIAGPMNAAAELLGCK